MHSQTTITRSGLDQISTAFELPPILGVRKLSGGHIHGTFRLFADTESFVAQRINTAVFQHLEACENNLRILSEVFTESSGVRIPQALRTLDSQIHFKDSELQVWRVSSHIAPSQSLRVPRSSKRAGEASRAFGTYVETLRHHAEASRFQDTIANFHNLPNRLAQLHDAVQKNPFGRLVRAESDLHGTLELANQLAPCVEDLGGLDPIVVHNDAKLANVLFDMTGKATHVIDLDTTMPGLATYDLGELLRSMSTLAPEDCPTVDNVIVRPAFVEAVLNGFLTGAKESMSASERRMLTTSCALMAAENAVRMLTDYFRGDQYFPVTHPDQNLHRSRVQRSIAEQLLVIVPYVLKRRDS